MTIRKTDQLDRPHTAESDRLDGSTTRDECCQSGCTVCILDYPDAISARDDVRAQAARAERLPPPPNISPEEIDQQLLDMLEAFERAESIVASLVRKRNP